MRAVRPFSFLMCALILLGIPASGPTRQPPSLEIETNLNVSVSPLILDFFINNTWGGQPSQFSFNVADDVGLDHAVFGCNATQTFSNDSSTPLSGTQAWANFTHTLPNFNCVISFQLWVWNNNTSTCATTGLRYIRVYTYNNTPGAWNTPYTSLIDAIKSIDSANNWASVEPYTQTVLAKKTTTDLANMIDNYASSGDWANVLKWSATCQKLDITRQTAIMNALGNFTMLGALPLTDTINNAFSVENKWGLYGYYYAVQFGASLTKWNITAAYQQFNSSVFYCLDHSNALPLWIHADGTSSTFSNRYYDEDADTVDCYLIFYSLLNVTDALNQALYCWNKLNVFHWNSAEQHYGYTSTSGYECEASFFLKIISTLRYYSPNLDDWTNVLTDIENRFLSQEWKSPQWLTAADTSAYAVVHMYPGNPQRRMDNTLGAWQALLGAYLQLSSTYENDIRDMLCGNTNTEPAWALLLRPEAGLFDNSTDLFKDTSTSSPASPNPTAHAEVLMFMLGIIPQTATTAFPLEELNYEYIQDLDCQMLQLNLTTRTITIPLISPGSLTFQYGVSPVTCNFNQPGVYHITFSNSWNLITSVEYESALPNNLIYLNEESPSPYDVTIAAYSIAESSDANVSLAMDGSPTGYETPHTFTDLTGNHSFTVPDTDASGDLFNEWNTGTNVTTITVSSEGKFTAYYGTPKVHDVAVTEVKPYKTVVFQGLNQNVTVTVLDLGGWTENLNVTLYANATEIETQEKTVQDGHSEDITFTWNATGFETGNYTISAYAWPVPNETDTSDNNLTGGWVTVSIEGDLTGATQNVRDFAPDGLVDMMDVGVVASYFLQPISPASANCDVTGPTQGVPDGMIDMTDIGIIASHYLQGDP